MAVVNSLTLSDSYWGSNQPDNDLNSEQYVLIQGSHQNEPLRWNDAQPTHESAYLIEYKDLDPKYTINKDFTSSQFIYIEGEYTWAEALIDAESRGGRLAVLNTQQK